MKPIHIAVAVITALIIFAAPTNPAIANVAMPVMFVLAFVEVASLANSLRDNRVRAETVKMFANSLGGRMKGSAVVSSGISIIVLVISAVVAFVVVSALFPVIDNAAYSLQTAASASNNTLIKAITPVIPYLIGLGLFIVILVPINILIDSISRRLGGGVI